MRRRRILSLACLALLGAAGGCQSGGTSPGETEGTAAGPDATLEQFFQALESGIDGAARSYVHDRARYEASLFTDDRLSAYEYRLAAVETVMRTTNAVTVSIDLEVTEPDGDVVTYRDQTVELRRNGTGRWKLYDGPDWDAITAEETARRTDYRIANRVQVIAETGLVTANDGENEIGVLELVATNAPGAQDIDVSDVTIQWLDESGSYFLVHESNYEGQDGAFAHAAIKDSDDSLERTGDDGPLLNSPDDRVRLVVDLGADDSDNEYVREAYDTIPGSRVRSDAGGLEPGATATLQLTTGTGASTTVRLNVPADLDGAEAVGL